MTGAVANEAIHPFISNNPKFSPFFDNCIGATDGTLIPAFIPASEQGPWRDRKGNITQNVLIVANFDLLYTYALLLLLLSSSTLFFGTEERGAQKASISSCEKIGNDFF
eukprot:gene67074-91859_t